MNIILHDNKSAAEFLYQQHDDGAHCWFWDCSFGCCLAVIFSRGFLVNLEVLGSGCIFNKGTNK